MMMHFDRLIETCGIVGWEERHQTLTMDRDSFVRFIRGLLTRFPFDEQWYLDTYPDVRQAIVDRTLASGWQHYLEFGYFEGRLPGLTEFDAEAYLRDHEDLSDLLKGDDFRSAAERHFISHGYREGRQVRAGRPASKRTRALPAKRAAVD